MGIGFIFVGIDAIKLGLTNMGGAVNFTQLQVSGITEILIFTAIGLLLTVVLQSTHAVLNLTLAALAGGQIAPEQAFALAIGSNVGSSISTAFVGFLGSERNGQRLALAHVLFNVVTAIISLLLFLPLSALVLHATAWVGLGDNGLIQLALFHTLFNVLGVAVFWRLQSRLAAKLKQWLPDRAEQTLPTLIAEPHEMRPVNKKHGTEAMYLSKASLRASDTAVLAVVNEIRHLSRLTLEVMCHAVYVPAQQLFEPSANTEDLRLQAAQLPLQLDADALYQQHIKGVYSELLGYINRIEVPLSDEQERVLQSCQALALQFAEAVKESKHLQKNLQQYLQSEDEVQQYYARLREYVFGLLLQVAPLSQDGAASLIAQPTQLQQGMQQFELSFGQEVLTGLREGKLSDRQTSSLMNDIAYARRIGHSLLEILAQAQHLLLQTSDRDTQTM